METEPSKPEPSKPEPSKPEPSKPEPAAQSCGDGRYLSATICKKKLSTDSLDLSDKSQPSRPGAVSRTKRAEGNAGTMMFTPLEGVVEPGAQDMFSPWINNAEVFANRGCKTLVSTLASMRLFKRTPSR